MAETDDAQLSFLVERELFAWWGGDDPAVPPTALGLRSTSESVRIVRPDRDSLATTRLPGALTPAAATLEALAATGPDERWGSSARAWQEIASGVLDGRDLDARAARLPTAAHAGLAGDTVTIWSARVAVRAASAAARADFGPPPGPALRPYQRAGAGWLLERLDTAGGAVLADEMGLGKTVQAIAVLVRSPGPHLVVCPASVVGTWRHELARFAPDLPVIEHRRGAAAPPNGVVISTYAMLGRDPALGDTAWDVAVLDEAQNIKNPATATARRARALDARARIALTGTPVENRLDDLWSLLAFTTPEVLGPRARFRRRFADASTGAAAQRLSRMVGPHLLRRRKDAVADELPPRIELTHELDPTTEQRRLHRAALDGALDGGLGSGSGRRGRVLALITKLKQVCVQPALVTDDDRTAGRSASWDRLGELVDEITDNGEAALVFTQYRRAGELFAEYLSERLGVDVPFLHGGLSRPARERMVQRFSTVDGPPVLLLSLRAAGTGLTLTRASHVLHLDRWWNPAVEAQASDRAHRIGQRRTVTVHTFVTRGTVEQLIADVHRGKRDLAGAVLGDNEGSVVGSIARLGDDELRAVLAGGTR